MAGTWRFYLYHTHTRSFVALCTLAGLGKEHHLPPLQTTLRAVPSFRDGMGHGLELPFLMGLYSVATVPFALRPAPRTTTYLLPPPTTDFPSGSLYILYLLPGSSRAYHGTTFFLSFCLHTSLYTTVCATYHPTPLTYAPRTRTFRACCLLGITKCAYRAHSTAHAHPLPFLRWLDACCSSPSTTCTPSHMAFWCARAYARARAAPFSSSCNASCTAPPGSRSHAPLPLFCLCARRTSAARRARCLNGRFCG